MQASGNLIAPAAELAARVQHGQADLHRGTVHLRMQIHGEAASVIENAGGTVGVQRDGNIGAIARQRFVDGVIYDFINQVVQAAHVGRPDIHARAFSDGLQTLKHLDLRCVVMISLLGHGATSLNAVNDFPTSYYTIILSNGQPRQTQP